MESQKLRKVKHKKVCEQIKYHDPLASEIAKPIFFLSEEPFEFSPENIRLQTALIYDGILLLAETFKQLGMDEIQPVSISCQNESTWEKGISISNFMRNVSFMWAICFWC